jgi:hypothetical protein
MTWRAAHFVWNKVCVWMLSVVAFTQSAACGQSRTSLGPMHAENVRWYVESKENQLEQTTQLCLPASCLFRFWYTRKHDTWYSTAAVHGITGPNVRATDYLHISYVRNKKCNVLLRSSRNTAKKDICGPYHSLNNFVYLLKIQGNNWMLRNPP